MGKTPADRLVDVGTLAEEFGCSERQIQLFVRAGMPKAGHGKYAMLPCYRWYAQKLKQDLADAQNKAGDLEYEQMRERRATADIKELDLAVKRGQLIPIDTYTKHVAAQFMAVRQNILAVAAQIAPQLEGLSRMEIKTRLQEKHRAVLTQLSEGKDIANDADDDGAESESAFNPDAKRAGNTAGTDTGSKGQPKARRHGPTRNSRTATGSEHKRLGRKKSLPAKRHK